MYIDALSSSISRELSYNCWVLLGPIIAEAGFDRAFASAPNHRNKSKQYELDAHAAFPIDMQPPPAYAETAVSQQPVPMSPLNPNMSRHRLSNIFTPERGW
eukprot:m.947147 g.947147  ORF g.947147 m.947147 type:complete len:101 (-) comp23848_c0_seq25:567-869(-)